VALLSLYFDEDAVSHALVAALRARDLVVFTALESGLAGRSDEEQLVFAATQGHVLYSYNVSDFHLRTAPTLR